MKKLSIMVLTLLLSISLWTIKGKAGEPIQRDSENYYPNEDSYIYIDSECDQPVQDPPVHENDTCPINTPNQCSGQICSFTSSAGQVVYGSCVTWENAGGVTVCACNGPVPRNFLQQFPENSNY